VSLNILIVDDSAIMRDMVAKALEASGLPIRETFTAADGREGLDVLASQWIDIVFTDVFMPGMNGEEMIDRIREDPIHAELPVVIISSVSSQERVSRLRSKANAYVHKPFTPEMLRDVLNDLTGVGCETELDVQCEEDLQAMLAGVTEAVFEALAFVLPAFDDLDETAPPAGKSARTVASIDFRGPFDGALALSVSSALVPVIATNMLGVESETEASHVMDDALKELMNVLCGNLLPRLTGDAANFDLAQARLLDDHALPEAMLGHPAAAKANLQLEEGLAEIALFAPVADLMQTREVAS
jgi:two-component system chemotaxis response regulator CheY